MARMLRVMCFNKHQVLLYLFIERFLIRMKDAVRNVQIQKIQMKS